MSFGITPGNAKDVYRLNVAVYLGAQGQTRWILHPSFKCFWRKKVMRCRANTPHCLWIEPLQIVNQNRRFLDESRVCVDGGMDLSPDGTRHRAQDVGGIERQQKRRVVDPDGAA